MASMTVSVVIPARNAEGTLARAVQSVLAQTSPVDEILVVDDASLDGTAAVASSFAGVRLLRLAEHHGAAGARNAGIAAANGDWIAFLDADDLWLPQKLERQRALAADDVSLIFCASEEFAADGHALGDTFRGGAVVTGPAAWKNLLMRNFVATPTVVARRALLLTGGGFDETLAVGEDQDMWIRLACAGALAYVSETLAQVYVQPGSLSRYRRNDQRRYVLPMIRRHIAAQRSRLSRSEVRAIIAARYANAGHIALAHGEALRGAVFLLQAIAAGYRPGWLRTDAGLMQPGESKTCAKSCY